MFTKVPSGAVVPINLMDTSTSRLWQCKADNDSQAEHDEVSQQALFLSMPAEMCDHFSSFPEGILNTHFLKDSPLQAPRNRPLDS